MWVRFLEDYDHKPKNNVILSYRGGEAYSVTHICGEEAIKAGKAVKIPTPNRSERHGEEIKHHGDGQIQKAARPNSQGDKARGQKANGARGRQDSGADALGSTG